MLLNYSLKGNENVLENPKKIAESHPFKTEIFILVVPFLVNFSHFNLFCVNLQGVVTKSKIAPNSIIVANLACFVVD